MKKRLGAMYGLVFTIYLFCLFYFLFFSEKYGRNVMENYSYNLVPFAEIKRFLVYREILGNRSVLLNLFGNVVGFLPFGFSLPVLFPRVRHAGAVILLSLDFSLIAECIQLVLKVGSFDVDDLILNTLGGFLGGILYFAGKAYFNVKVQYRKRIGHEKR